MTYTSGTKLLLRRVGASIFVLVTGILTLTPVAFRSAGAQRVDSVWTIRGGTYTGQAVAIDPAAVNSRKSRFWRWSNLRGEQRIIGWNPSRLPIAVAFRPSAAVGAADSAAFWSSLERMEQDLGMHVFQPVSIAPGEDPDDVIVIDVKAMAADDGKTLVTWSTHGSVYDARVYFSSRATMHDERVVVHEMMHALGFGHTSAWASVMNPNVRSIGRVTQGDAAYAQLAITLRAANEKTDMWDRIALAVSRESTAPLENGNCEIFVPPLRSPATCSSYHCSPLSASCRAARSIEPWPER